MHIRVSGHAVGLASCVALVGAQASAQSVSAPTLSEITVSGRASTADGAGALAPSLQGDALAQSARATLGGLLDGVPGVAATGFGPNASRPVLRGLDGERSPVLLNGGASFDASGISADHAVAIDPLSVERVDILRGPAALAFGAHPIGGAVNVIDNRIPREPLFEEGGIAGQVELGYASGAREGSGGLRLETGNSRFGLHADMSSRTAGDTAVPRLLPCARPGAAALSAHICNSWARTDSGALGGSLFWDHGYLGLSVSQLQNRYGTVAEDDVSIRMRSTRVALQGEARNLGGWLSSLSGQWSQTRYRHTEFEGAEPGTLFSNQGDDLRLQARQRSVAWGGGRLDGLLGLQLGRSRFSVSGEEAFLPRVHGRTQALFAHESFTQGRLALSLAVRGERVRLRSWAAEDGDSRFVSGERGFSPVSLALGARWALAPGWALTGTFARTARAPREAELFANGPHLATGTWESGNPALALERALGAEAGAEWTSGPHRAAFSVYRTRYASYIGMQATGRWRTSDGAVVDADAPQALPEMAFVQSRANFLGAEAQGRWRLRETGATLDLLWRADLVRARDLDSGQPLPRIAPARAGATLVWTQGPWSARVGFDRAAAQRRVPAGELSVAGYTLWHLGASREARLSGGARLLAFVRLENAGNALAYSATALLTQIAPGRAPLPGRSLRLGAQVIF